MGCGECLSPTPAARSWLLTGSQLCLCHMWNRNRDLKVPQNLDLVTAGLHFNPLCYLSREIAEAWSDRQAWEH